MPPLKLVPPAEPSPKQAVIERIKALPRPDGLLQCPRCGSRTIITKLVNSAFVNKGRRTGGTEIDKDICADCYIRGIRSDMVTDIKRVT